MGMTLAEARAWAKTQPNINVRVDRWGWQFTVRIIDNGKEVRRNGTRDPAVAVQVRENMKADFLALRTQAKLNEMKAMQS